MEAPSTPAAMAIGSAALGMSPAMAAGTGSQGSGSGPQVDGSGSQAAAAPPRLRPFQTRRPAATPGQSTDATSGQAAPTASQAAATSHSHVRKPKAPVEERWEVCTRIKQLWEVPNKAHTGTALLKLFSKIEIGLDLFLPTAKSKASLTFFELYIPEKEEHCFIGAFFIKDSRKSLEILTKINEMAGLRIDEQTEVLAAVDNFILSISCKYGHRPNRGVFYPSFLLRKYYCRSNSSSNYLGYAPTDACSIGLIIFSRNIVIHPRNLSFFQDDKHALPPMEIVSGEFVELPQEILMDIFSLLDFPDLVRVGSVCSSWNSAYTSICSFGQYKCSQTPCLIYTSKSADEHTAFLYSLVEKRAYKLTLPDPPIHRRYLIGSSHGWLVTADERSEMHLVNPVTSEQITLPSVSTIEQVTPIFDEAGMICSYRFSRHTAKATMGPPSTYSLGALREYLFHKALIFYDTSAGSYFVVLIHNPFGQLSFARLGDETWTWLPPHSHFDDCIYKDGLLYAVTLHGAVIAFDISGAVVTTQIIFDWKSFYGNERVYIVQAPGGDLLQVRRRETWIRDLPHKHRDNACACCATFEGTRWNIAIYKVCIASRNLVEIHSLDDYVLFLGHNQSLGFRAEEHPHLKPNHIYFTDDCKSVSSKCRRGYRLVIGILNIQTMSMGEIVSPQLWPNCMAPLWIIPNPRKIEPNSRKNGFIGLF